MERKQFLKALGLIGAGSILPGQVKANRIDLPVKPDKQRVLRIAHITDIHIADHKAASKGFAKCLHSIQNMEDAPDFIINGGDAIEDALFRTKPDVNKQWALWHAILKNECSLKIKNTLGNHDIWGLYTEKKRFFIRKKIRAGKITSG